MQTYAFYVKGKSVKTIPKVELTDAELRQLKEDGFKKHHIEVEAISKKDAAIKLKETNNENLNALGEFSGNHLFMVLMLLSLVVLYCLYSFLS